MKKSYVDLGLLIIRVVLGVSMVLHGEGKVFGGPDTWEAIGAKGMGSLGINFLPVFWGFMAAISEFGGGILLALGVLFRPAALLVFVTMMVAMLTHIVAGDDFVMKSSHAMELGAVALGLFLMGPGKYTVAKLKA